MGSVSYSGEIMSKEFRSKGAVRQYLPAVQPDLKSGGSEYQHLQCDTPTGWQKKVVVFHIGLQILILHAVGLQIRPNGAGFLVVTDTHVTHVFHFSLPNLVIFLYTPNFSTFKCTCVTKHI